VPVSDNERSVSITRTGPRAFTATNRRGGTLAFGEGQDADFTPIELLLVAIAGCSAIDIDYITARRAEPVVFEAVTKAEKLADDKGNHLGNVTVDLQIVFPEGPEGDRARAILERAAIQTRDRLCTVTRTVELPTPVSFLIEGREI
jgi:uncharacterized OsmC-like protein